MKKLLFLFLAAMPVITLAEETNGSLLNEDVVWTMGYFSPYQAGQVSYIEFKLEGDSLIGDITYKRKYFRKLKQDEKEPQVWTASDCFVGQDRDRFFYYDKTFHKESQLLMDFSATVGDVIPYVIEETPINLRVENVSDTVFATSTDKQKRICIYVKDMARDLTDVWIEGIGSIKYGIESLSMAFVTGSIPLLVKCTKGDVVLYNHPDAPVITNIRWPSVQNREADSATFNLQGRRLNGQPQHGIYIKDRKKYVK